MASILRSRKDPAGAGQDGGPPDEALSSVFELAAEGLCLFGADGRALRANVALLALAGLEADAVVGQPPQALLAALEIEASAFDQALAGARVELERRALGQGRDRRWWSGRLEPAGEGLLLSAVDLTDLVRAEREARRFEALRDALERRAERAEATLAAVCEAVPGAVLVADARGRVTVANAPARALFGTREGDAWGLGGGLTLHRPNGEPLPFDELPLARAVERGEPSREVELLARGAGWETTLRGWAGPVRDPHGALLGGVSVLEDVGAHREAARELETVVEQAAAGAAVLETVLEASGEGVVLYGPAGEVLQMNPASERILGLSDQERQLPPWARVGLAYPQLPDGSPFPNDRTPAARALRGEVVRGQLMRFSNPASAASSAVWVSASAAPILAEEGGLLGAIAIYADVTARHGLELEREGLLSVLARELRAPLAALEAQAEELARAAAGATEVGALAETLLAEARRAGRVAGGLVDISRLRAGELVLTPEPLELRAFILGLRERFEHSLGPGRVRLVVPESLPRVIADPRYLERILFELLASLAGSQSAEGELTLLAAEREGEAGIYLMRDARAGDELLVGQLHADGGSAAGGTLGLDVASRLAELHGARLGALAEPGMTGFSLMLPSVETRQFTGYEELLAMPASWQD